MTETTPSARRSSSTTAARPTRTNDGRCRSSVTSSSGPTVSCGSRSTRAPTFSCGRSSRSTASTAPIVSRPVTRPRTSITGKAVIRRVTKNSPIASATDIPAGTVTAGDDMIDATVAWPRSCSVSRARRWASAAATTNTPMKASQRPPTAPATSSSSPTAIIAKPKPRPIAVAVAVARARSPWRCQSSACRTRPPSSG
ncbi:hypothetical protein PAI11_05490 [Patulibacter medicamentivorans]|uniref:Uncharacterized protein n=1 Tax=Patulibacter medicamentivorans TaxID=1097667 RepID=H0E187_9ACTN|nr:hypothetical protein PAI11_05490 [Patulibacter medicamentivorans]